jgi:hypothetical protein
MATIMIMTLMMVTVMESTPDITISLFEMFCKLQTYLTLHAHILHFLSQSLPLSLPSPLSLSLSLSPSLSLSLLQMARALSQAKASEGKFKKRDFIGAIKGANQGSTIPPFIIEINRASLHNG